MTMMGMKCKKGKKTEKEPPENQRGARTDLAMEERELWHKEAGQTTKLPGVAAQEIRRRGILTTVVRVLNEEGAKELHKPVGTYVTLELENGISPESVKWSTSDSSIATVYNGNVTALGRGVCVIRAEYEGQVAEGVVRCNFK